MIDSHALSVGADAFLERDEQILPTVCFVHDVADPFVITADRSRYFGTWMTKYERAPYDRELRHHVYQPSVDEMMHDLGVLSYFDRITPAMPAHVVRRVMSLYERGTGNHAVYAWLGRRREDDDNVVRGICDCSDRLVPVGVLWVAL